MFQPSVLALFLYFPEDKSEYIPAVISLTIFMIAAFFTMRFIMRISKREAEKTKALEEQIKNNQSTQRDS
ncbi:hypothetical protein J1P26_04085 [Neobacillus sp. MM2021_6]|uniref:hypothetical protein n=1 Tax=Bacillaceae TaxID=186817 RepID=UPI00140D6859|nr:MULTISPECIES: hypothetical protein [Bacillaceae]MBO0958901.1 hypothetical protein [Neobacillus sp. MM2021_6]NHC17630.1 hypothetical protein [Bacillus sp. MM2020_4]WML41028.1 hypothetical protein RCG19_05025 [Neobacillus sp. OS1-2]